ncbi:MAG: CBS domain-containing protein [Candidatus Obscuribacterales bacterium]
MTPQPVAVNSFDLLDDILFLFSEHKFSWLPVTHHDRVIGIILQSDVLKALFEQEEQDSGMQLGSMVQEQ